MNTRAEPQSIPGEQSGALPIVVTRIGLMENRMAGVVGRLPVTHKEMRDDQ